MLSRTMHITVTLGEGLIGVAIIITTSTKQLTSNHLLDNLALVESLLHPL